MSRNWRKHPLRIVIAAALLPATVPVAAQGALSALVPNTVSVEPRPGVGAATPPDPIFAGAVEDALAAQGFTTLHDPGHARLVAALTITRTMVGTTSSTVPVAGSSATAGGVRGVGGSFSVNLPTGKQRTVALTRTELDVRLIGRADGRVIWEGGAVSVRPDDLAPAALAALLARAVLADRVRADGPIAVP